MTSLMIGQLVTEGKIKESDTFIQYFLQYRTGGSFDKVTVQTLLDMQAGVDVTDNYPTGPSGWGVAIAQMYATTDLNFFMKHNRKMSWDPGTKADYRSVDRQMLGFIINKVTGEHVADCFSQDI
jgi:CubicO group peptidase (beta-lactamase class C family)